MSYFQNITLDNLNYKIALPHKDTDYIQKKIFEEALPYELPMLIDMAGRLSADSLVLDVGANVGNHSLYIAAAVGCSVHAFEPNVELCNALRESIARNNFDRKITVHCLGVGKETARASFANLQESNLGGQSLKVETDGAGEIDIIRLDDVAFDKPVTAMKIDVEGMELAVLEGAAETIRLYRPTLYIECQAEQDFTRVQSWLTPYGYCYWETFNATPTHLFIRSEDISDGRRIERLMMKVVRDEYRLEAKVRSLSGSLEQANQKYRSASEQIATLNEQLHAANLKYRDVSGQIDVLKEKLDAAGLKDRDAIEQIATLKARLHAASLRDSDSIEQLATLREQHRAISLQYRDASEQIGTLKEQLQAVNLQYRDASEHNETLAEQLHAISLQYLDAGEQIDTLKEKNRALSLQYRDASEQIGTLKDQLHASNLQYRDASEQIGTLKEQLHAISLQHLDAGEQIETLKDQLHASNLQFRDASGQIGTLKRQLEDASSKCRTLTDDANHSKRELEKQRQEFLEEINKALEQHELELQSFRETELALRRQLNSVNLKYRNITHQFDTVRRSRAYKMATLVKKASNSSAMVVKKPWRILKIAGLTARSTQTLPLLAPEPASAIVESVQVPGKRLPEFSKKPSAGVVEGIDEPLDNASARRLRVACIMDEFTYHSYLPECDLHALTPGDWENELNRCKPELLIVESAWRGKGESWGSKVGHASQELQDIVSWCHQRDVPTIFWNKEDPVHFQTFLNTARLFDFVFTTDIDCIHRYKGALGHDRVYLLPFACQPRVNNPIETYERKDAFCFAGAYYARYPSRTRDLDNFVSTLADYRPLEIYDRNHGKEHPDYQFPDQYVPYIVGTLPYDQIDKAYKGYRYAINLNSIKQSQTMFARRVFELLASNTITVSNFSRGIRLLFGDLVITSDEGSEIIRKLQAIAEGDATLDKLDKFRLAALRKVMREHTYEDRLAYIVAKVKGEIIPDLLPAVMLVGYARTAEEAQLLVDHFRRQSYHKKQLLVVTAVDIAHDFVGDDRIRFVPELDATSSTSAFTGRTQWICGLAAEDYYGPNYLIDLVLATRYSDAAVITKQSHYLVNASGDIEHVMPHAEYRYGDMAAQRAALARRSCVAERSLGDFAASIREGEFIGVSVLAIDRFNYCRNGLTGAASETHVQNVVDDLATLNEGLSLAEVVDRAERIEPEQKQGDLVAFLAGPELAKMFKPSSKKPYNLFLSGQCWIAESGLPDGKHEYIYAVHDVTPEELGYQGDNAAAYLDVEPGLNVQFVMVFLDDSRNRIDAAVRPANKNLDIKIPQGTRYIRLGLRFYGGGSAIINGLVLGHRRVQPPQIMGRSRYLLLTNHYPNYDNLYRNGFVHSRVKAYKEKGVNVDIFRLRADEPLSYHEFEDVDVMTGSQEVLEILLSSGEYEHVLVHFLDETMWEVLSRHIKKTKMTVWIHGAEIQPYHRREYNYTNDAERETAKLQSEKRLAFWREILQPVPEKLKLVFVSRYFAEEVMEDLGFRLAEGTYEIIHNPIDTDLFNYVRKCEEQRLRLLSIRPYETRKYANDLTVEALLLLCEKPWFGELEIRLIGDGKLFEETLARIRHLKNVEIDRRYLTHGEIAVLHKGYGIFLTPTRMDAQGVSRDEAMASGLVPVTNAVAAIPEFVDAECGIVVPPEDAQAMADGIEALYHNPALFLKLSENAARRVRGQSAKKLIIEQELALFVHAAALPEQLRQPPDPLVT